MEKRYIVWVNHGYEGWSPNPYDTLKECVEHDSYGSEKVITTGKIDFEIKEVVEK